MQPRACLTLTLALSAILGIPAQADHGSKRTLSLETAKVVALAGATEARRGGAGGVIAVVDDGGHLVYLERLDDTFPAAASVATGKARTAATFRMPTRNFENAIKNGRVSIVGVPEITPFQGGVPLIVDGHVIGAVGVSGAKSAQHDDEIATVAAAAVGGSTVSNTGSPPTTPAVSFIDGRQVAAAFAKGAPLLETGAYKIHASRRDAPGMAEIHERDTDIIYVTGGQGTFVTGGAVVDGKKTAPDELRGSAIDGGETRRIARGDVIVVPHGTPHWFREVVSGPLTYYVVKAPTGNGGAR